MSILLDVATLPNQSPGQCDQGYDKRRDPDALLLPMNKYVLEDRSDHTKQHPAEKTADMRGHVDKPEAVADADQP